jgi:hypothetical protein
MMAEPEDARLTGRTHDLERRLLGLNVTRPRKAIVTPTSWLARTFQVFHEGSTTPAGTAFRRVSVREETSRASLRAQER